MQQRTKLRYFETRPPVLQAPNLKPTAHSEFLRTGRISRRSQDWLEDERRYLTYEEVGEQTERRLSAAGENAYERINAFHASIRFPKVLFSRSLDERPHLGYCHVTAARSHLGAGEPVAWSFYICNFLSDVGGAEDFFRHIRTQYGRMYFAVAIEPEERGGTRISRSIRDNGLLFRTSDPMEALKNVLLLGTSDQDLREMIRQI
ncbi:DUF6656 family protein [Rhizobium sp. SAFR-030]|uniref:DUF6656 family protein n=1 Tax=Rhizobium sp. SAFR-030 TaxID=3387277 RepID=UPI003F7E3F65